MKETNWHEIVARVEPTILTSDLGDETLLLDLKAGVYYGLDAIGTRIWTLFVKGMTLSQVCEQISEEFDADLDDVRRDLGVFIDELRSKSLLTLRSK